jgi:RNA-directed DNA polymerase
MGYKDIISVENLLEVWKEFIKGKRRRKDVQIFETNIFDNLINLHQDLKTKTYKHGSYERFNINDPKPRNISKATVRDRLVHHLLYQSLYWYFDKRFIHDSYSCRVGKGTHKAIKQFTRYSRKVSQNYTKQCWVLKCDIKRFFDSIDHDILVQILKGHIQDQDSLNLWKNIICSFEKSPGKGLPLGNLTSQLLVNVYMNEFDQYIKHKLKIKHYIRYADDFVILSNNKQYLEILLPKLKQFLNNELRLELHPHKVSIATFHSGIDFLGWVHFPNHRVLRTATKRKMFRNLKESQMKPETIQSYLGLLSHGNAYKLRRIIKG